MAANGYQTPLQDLAKGLVATVKGLTVAQLKDVLRKQNLTVSGVKSELQIRLIADIEKAQYAGNRAALDSFQRSIRGGPADPTPAAYSSPYQGPTPFSSASPTYSPAGSNFVMGGGPYRPAATSGPRFTDSPFYTIQQSLSQVVELKIRETTRDNGRAQVILPPDVAAALQRDSKNRVMVFCTTSNSGTADISFPHQVELKCNGEDVKANLRGLKNKPGSTRPADITQFIRKKQAGFRNEVEVVYALTNKEKPATQKFYMVVNHVVKNTVDELVRNIRRGKNFSKEAVIREMKKEAADPDIEVSSRVISLKCPLSYTRLQTPCRGTNCKHNQCFDAASYLQLQEQAPTWTCPQCNKPVPWSQLVLDHYVLDILNNTSEDTEQVTVEPDGTWHRGESKPQPSTSRKRKLNATPDSDDEDLVLIEDSRPTNGHISQMLTPSSVRTPPISGREDSVATSTTQRSASKRPRKEVIDLTLSDDDDDQDARPPVKRNPTNTSQPNGNVFGSATTMNSTLPTYRPRPPDQPQSINNNNNRYQFQLPPLHSTQSFNFPSSPFGGSGSGAYGGGGGGGGGSNY